MIKINIDPSFQPSYGNDSVFSDFKIFQFAGGEWHVKLGETAADEFIDKLIITCRIHDMNDLMKILIVQDAFKRLSICSKIELFIPYLPYARMDRVNQFGESFTLKVFANILNSAKFDRVIIYDAHSDVASALIDNCLVLNIHSTVSSVYDIIDNSSDIYLVSPDAGASKKINALYEHKYNRFAGVINCYKKRSTVDGGLSGFEVLHDKLNGETCLIVDDIISYGGTFKGIAKALKEKGAGRVYLFASHHEGVADYNSLKEAGIEHLFTTNSLGNYNCDFVTCLNL